MFPYNHEDMSLEILIMSKFYFVFLFKIVRKRT